MKENLERENLFLKAALFLEKDKSEHLLEELENVKEAFYRANAELVEVYHSKRWRITEPFAKLHRTFKTKENSRPNIPDIKEDGFCFDESIFQKGQKFIFVSDQYVPRFDKDAGSRSIYEYMLLFQEMGYHVIFMGEDFQGEPPYAEILEKKGITILSGEQYRLHWKEWIKHYGSYIDIVLLNRPHVARTFLDYWKENTKAKVVYMGCDLHFLRAQREYDLTGDPEVKKSIAFFEALELTVMYQADKVLLFSDEEQRVVREKFDINAVTVPLYYFRKMERPKRRIDKTQDLLFVGGFLHRPNVDGVQWFVKEIWPIIKRRLPHIKFYIVGSNPPDSIKALATDDVVITGFVTDEQLQKYYENCRICVLPLRFGAGVKGKTIEALREGIPIVSTAIGIEGMEAVETVISAVDGAAEFARRVIELYESETELDKCTKDYADYLNRYFSYERTKAIFENIFES